MIFLNIAAWLVFLTSTFIAVYGIVAMFKPTIVTHRALYWNEDQYATFVVKLLWRVLCMTVVSLVLAAYLFGGLI